MTSLAMRAVSEWRLRRIFLAAFCIVGISACSSGGRPNAASSTAAAVAGPASGRVAGALSPISCPSSSVVDQALGTSLSGPITSSSGLLITCKYASGNFKASASIVLQQGANPAIFGSNVKRLQVTGLTTTTIAGLGDLAVEASIESGPDRVITVVAMHGKLLVTATAPASLPALESLVSQVLAVS